MQERKLWPLREIRSWGHKREKETENHLLFSVPFWFNFIYIYIYLISMLVSSDGTKNI